jgi:hypothetical protein
MNWGFDFGSVLEKAKHDFEKSVDSALGIEEQHAAQQQNQAGLRNATGRACTQHLRSMESETNVFAAARRGYVIVQQWQAQHSGKAAGM